MFDFLPGKQASIKSITKGSHDTRLSQNNPGDGRRETRTPIHTLKSYFPLSTSCKEFFYVFLVSNKAASCFEFLSAFTFGNKTEFGVFFILHQKMLLLHGNLMPFLKEVFHGQKEHKTKHTLDMPCQQLHWKETSRQIQHQQGWKKSNREELTGREDAHPPSSSSFLPTVPGTAGLFVTLIDTVG